MKGADQCPKCASRKTADLEVPPTINFYARTIRVCGNCKAAWEPFEIEDLLDNDDPISSFKAPCNNCAFRAGSPERKSGHLEEIKETLGFHNSFYCHKGVPLSLDRKDKNGFEYPKKPDGSYDKRKLRLCKGYLRWLVQNDRKVKRVLEGMRETPEGASASGETA